jgi:SAM-dependent methyltransferase
MRDPAASLRFEGNRVVRDLYKPLDQAHFLHAELAQRWSTEGRLVQFAIQDETRVESQRLSFVSQPSEWSDAQLFAAAKLTLELQMEAVDASFDLKDGSAWNVIFDGCRPVFCDLLSFEGLCERPWWAFGQYGRHFLLPLLVSKRAGLHAHASFSAWRDGMPPGVARDMLGWTAMLGRYGALLAGRKNSAHSSVAVERAAIVPLDDIKKFRRRLHAALDWQLSGLKPAPPSAQGWGEYEQDRPHYGGDSLSSKRRLIGEWLAQLSPKWVLDLGCNTGEFTKMALAGGASVIALDADHDCIQRLFLEHTDDVRLHAVVAPLDDLRSSRGWAGTEHPGMDQRLEQCADVVLMLALVHHLAIGSAIPLEAVARFAYRCTRSSLVIELLDADDPQLVALCHQRRRAPEEFTRERQRDAFVAAGFSVVTEQRLEGAARSLLLLTK